MRNYFLFFLPAVFLAMFSPKTEPRFERTYVKCSPEELRAAFATDVFSVKNGDYYDGSVWSTGRVPERTDNVVISHALYTNNRSVFVGSTTTGGGKLTMRKGSLQFRGINEQLFQGSGMSSAETPNDIGLWVEGSGELDLQGEAKRAWTTLVGSAVRGNTSITVNDASGWKVNDEIFIVPTDKPDPYDADWNDATNSGSDKFAIKFERRVITSITGNTVSFATPLAYDHLAVTSTAMGKTWTAEVGNLTRSVVIEGTKTGRSHIFIRSQKAQTIKFVEGRNLGPRKAGGRGSLVNGRYGIHFHHCGDGSRGSVVESNSFHDLGNRAYVPHESHGITFKSNISFAHLEASFWWDFQDISHDITYDGNLAALRMVNGDFGGSVGFELGQGDDNRCINNVAVYEHYGDPHQQGAFAWNTNNVGVWIFFNNLSHSNITGLFVWQNNGDNHVNENYWSYNNVQGAHHGAYINSYLYKGGGHYNSLFKFEAIQGNTVDMFQNIMFDGAGKLDYLVEVLTSPNRGMDAIRGPMFTGYLKAAVLMNTSIFTGEPNAGKGVDIIMPTGNLTKLVAFSPISIYNSYFRIQPVSGQPIQVSQAGTSNISAFAPTSYGTGSGLNARYYNGKDFNSLAFTRLDPMIKFAQWSVDPEQSPTGVHHKITPGGPYSVVWDGYYEPQYSGQHQFSFESFGGVRLYLDGNLIFQRWEENRDRVMFDGPLIALQLGRKYKLKIEHFNVDGERGIQFFTKQGGRYLNVPPSQLYPEDNVQPPQNRAPIVSAGPDRVTRDTLVKVEGSASDPDNNLEAVTWSGPATVKLSQNLSDAAHVLVRAQPGTYTLKIQARDKAGLTASDSMILTIQAPVDTTAPPIPKPDTLMANAGPDIQSALTEVTLDGSKSTGKNLAVNWYHDEGPASWNLTDQNSLITKANRLGVGVHLFRLRIRDTRTGKVSEDKVYVTIGTTPPPQPTVVKIVYYYSDGTTKEVIP